MVLPRMLSMRPNFTRVKFWVEGSDRRCGLRPGLWRPLGGEVHQRPAVVHLLDRPSKASSSVASFSRTCAIYRTRSRCTSISKAARSTASGRPASAGIAVMAALSFDDVGRRGAE